MRDRPCLRFGPDRSDRNAEALDRRGPFPGAGGQSDACPILLGDAGEYREFSGEISDLPVLGGNSIIDCRTGVACHFVAQRSCTVGRIYKLAGEGEALRLVHRPRDG